MKKSVYIVCCTPFFGDTWNWFAEKFDREQFQWKFFHDRPKGIIEKYVKQPNIAMIRACLQAVDHIKKYNADLLITHDPRASFWCAIFVALLGVKTEHIAYSFNFPELPRGIKFRLMKWAFAHINKFIVYSTFEQKLYSEYFEIPIEHFTVVFWSVGTPTFHPEEPIETGEYICAIGGNSRDYETLIKAMEKLPEIPIILIVRPENLKGLALPQNVKVLVNIPFSSAMNVLKYSRFMVIPLKGSEVPCGHVTLVAAMHLGKTFIITNSQGVSDYAHNEENAITCDPFDPDGLAEAIPALWNHPEKCQKLSENALLFAKEYCSEESAVAYLKDFLSPMLE